MSQSRGIIDGNPELESALDRVQQWYHIPTLLVLLGFMLWNRVRNYSNFIVDGEVLFSGTDPWYHYRSTMYVVQNWPATMPFDPWTFFPYGTRTGQFGTLMDQVVATVALLVGFGSPSEQTVGMIALVTPTVLATLAGIPTYFVGRRLGGRIGGVTAVLVLALSSGTFLQRSLVGVYDHQVAEGLLQVLSVFAVMVAVSVAERDKPIYEQFLERDVAALREVVGYSLLAGFAISMYLWTWPPAVLLLGILGVFFLLWLTLEFVRGKSPEHVAIAGVLIMGTVVVLQLASIRTLELTAVDSSPLQPLLAGAVGAGCAFMAWLARYMENEGYDRNIYPVTVSGIIIGIAVLMAVLTPDLFSYFINQVLRVIGFTSSPAATVTSVGEATPLRNAGVLYRYHGLALFVAVVGALLVVARQFLNRDAPAEQFLVVIWGAFILAATFTQVRFGVYLVFPVASLTALVVNDVVRWTNFSLDGGVEVYEVITISALVLIIVGTLLLVGPTAMATGDTASPGDEPAAWTEGMSWMQEHTPAEGAYGTGGNGTLEYYGTYADREDYDYQSGEYGVLSWWDYGHIITVQGERIPNANPFQQGAELAANFLLAPNESQANDVLDNLDEEDASTRYVAVDWKMANTYSSYSGGKFFAPPRFYSTSNVSQGDYYGPIYDRQSGQRFNLRTQAYYNSTVIRLYEYHGSAMEPQPVVLDWEIAQQQGQQFRAVPANSSAVRVFNTTAEAREYARQDGTARVGGFGGLPSERVPALEHYRYVGSSERSAYESGAYNRGTLIESQFLEPINILQAQNGTCGAGQTAMPVGGQSYCMGNGDARVMSTTNPAWTKLFERVPGGTIAGSGPANSTVEARVQMQNNVTNETFVYSQRAQTGPNGTFEMTVPYSTTGYDQWGTDQGYTDVSVQAQGPYEFVLPTGGPTIPLNGTAQVTEGQVLGENNTSSTVSLTVDSQIQPTTPEDGTANETTDTTNETTDTTTNESSTPTTTEGTATPTPAIASPTAEPVTP